MSLDEQTSSEISEAQADLILKATDPKKKGHTKGKQEVEKVIIPKLQVAEVIIEIIGDSELIVNRFSDKAIKMILDKQMGKPMQGREKKVPENDFLGSLYPLNGKTPKISKKGDRVTATGCTFGFPANALKLAAVSACRQDLGIAMTKALGAFHIIGYHIPILDTKGKPAIPYMRRDMVRLAPPARVADVRFRGCFENWTMKVPIRYNTRVLSLDEIANLLNTAGFAVGLGEWRPEKKGNCGMFRVA
jgi:hypothetical protein